MCKKAYIRFLSGSKYLSIPVQGVFAKQVIRSKNWIAFATAFEQRFDIALENYAEIERVHLEQALQNKVFRASSTKRILEARHVLNRHLSNFLSSWRLYIDQTLHALSSAFGSSSEEIKLFRETCSEQYDRNFGYRVINALRNHALHRGLPTHAIKFGYGRQEDDDRGVLINHTVVFSISPKAIQAEGGFKKSILNELLAFVDREKLVPLLPLIQSAMTGLAEVHGIVRERIQPTFLEAEEKINEVFDLAGAESAKPVGLVSIHIENKPECDGSATLAPYHFDSWKSYLEKNAGSKDFEKKVISLS